VQSRTVEVLRRPAATFPDDFVADLRADLEGRLEEIDPPGRVVLSKGRLNLLARCEGSFAADLAGEREAFAHRRDTTVGSIAHRAAQADVARHREAEPDELVGYALDKMLEDRALALFWADLSDIERSELLAAAARQLVLFREMFPPLDPSWQPLPELPMTVRLLDGRVILRGRPDLVLGIPPQLPIDLKTGDPRPEHVEDGRFYALMMTLMFRRPPVRVATAYLDSLELAPEEVEPRMLRRAADRVVQAAAVAAELENGRDPELTPGRYCAWCPRSQTCPVALVPAGVD
jgi:PD-(D/E)XK nuclease superfamily protein